MKRLSLSLALLLTVPSAIALYSATAFANTRPSDGNSQGSEVGPLNRGELESAFRAILGGNLEALKASLQAGTLTAPNGTLIPAAVQSALLALLTNPNSATTSAFASALTTAGVPSGAAQSLTDKMAALASGGGNGGGRGNRAALPSSNLVASTDLNATGLLVAQESMPTTTVVFTLAQLQEAIAAYNEVIRVSSPDVIKNPPAELLATRAALTELAKGLRR